MTKPLQFSQAAPDLFAINIDVLGFGLVYPIFAAYFRSGQYVGLYYTYIEPNKTTFLSPL